ncbi:MAG: bifunctional DNA primase/polymerase [Meiothermus silvanus]|nr:bifunctional DNA primase/polymerase [Allomeiothermus silvanus]
MRKASEYYTQSALLSKALEYARLGYAVLPLLPGEKRPHPRLAPHGLRDATLNPEVIHRWWRGGAEAGVGLLPPTQVLVLDIDAIEVWDGLLGEHPELGEAPRQRTPRGGRHIFLRLPAGVRLSASTKALQGLDLRGVGRAYLVASPTALPTGIYHWEVPLLPPDELPPVPQGVLLRLLPEPSPTPPESQPAGFRGVGADTLARRLEGLLRWACERVAAAPQGQRHNTLLAYARLMGGYVHLGLAPEEATASLVAAAVQAGLPAPEAERTTRDGLRHGQAHPLPLPESPRSALWADSRSRFPMFYSRTLQNATNSVPDVIDYFGAGVLQNTKMLRNDFGALGHFGAGALQNNQPRPGRQKPDFGAFYRERKTAEGESAYNPRLRFSKPRLGGW